MRPASTTFDPAPTPSSAPSVCLWNPVGFDPRDFLCERLRHRADLARFLVHKIIWANVFGGADKKGFVPLKAEYLRRFFPDSRVYGQVMRSLLDGGAIISDNHYAPGEKCFGYKLGEAFSASRHHRLAITNPDLARKVATWRASFPKALKGVQRHLHDHLIRVEIDRDAALDLIRDRGFDPIAQTAVEFIHSKEFLLKTCVYGRVHTNLTNLKRELRQFLRVRGERLVNLDIRNSQPLVFAAILKSRYEFNPDQTAELVPEDVVRYVELCQTGRFYDHLMEETGIAPERRSHFKANFFGRVFFCRNRPVTPEATMFGDIFPNVYSVILAEKEADHAALARRLQLTESEIMIGGVASRCMAEIPHVFIGTIHDSVLTTPAYADAVRAIMTEEFRKVDLVPTIRGEDA